MFFAAKVAQLVHVSARRDEVGSHVTYIVNGQIFFASAENFLRGFVFDETAQSVVIDVSRAHFWDITAVGALDKAVTKLRKVGARVEVVGLNEASATMVERFATHDKDAPIHEISHL